MHPQFSMPVDSTTEMGQPLMLYLNPGTSGMNLLYPRFLYHYMKTGLSSETHDATFLYKHQYAECLRTMCSVSPQHGVGSRLSSITPCEILPVFILILQLLRHHWTSSFWWRHAAHREYWGNSGARAGSSARSKHHQEREVSLLLLLLHMHQIPKSACLRKQEFLESYC